jgi:hypothetical protein
MYGDHPKFRARLQTISVKHVHLCSFWRLGSELNSKFSGPKTGATSNLGEEII